MKDLYSSAESPENNVEDTALVAEPASVAVNALTELLANAQNQRNKPVSQHCYYCGQVTASWGSGCMSCGATVGES